MRSEGQRQDVAYLALAVAVLAVAVALFVGMRAVQKRQPEEPKEEAAPQVEVEEPVAEEPPPETNGRDPFKTQSGSTPSPTAGPAGVSHDLRLVGIVMEEGARPMAIIRSAKKRHYSRVGDRVGNYTVVAIGANQATLADDGDRFTLVLWEPEPEE
jgi:hypothetical protein